MKCSMCQRETENPDKVLLAIQGGMTMIGNNVSWIPVYYYGGAFEANMCSRCIEMYCIEEATLVKQPEGSHYDYKMTVPLKEIGPNEEGGLNPLASISCSGP